MKKIYALVLISLIAMCNIAFGQYKGKIDTLVEMSSMTYDEASDFLSDFRYTEEYDLNEYMSNDNIHSYVLDTAEYIQVPSLTAIYSKNILRDIKTEMSIRGVVVETYKDEEGADCYYYEGFSNDYLLISDRRNKIIVVTTAKK